MTLETIELKIAEFLQSYRHHILAGIAAARAANPAKAQVHHRLSYKYLSAAEDLLKAAAKEDFTGFGDLESGITDDDLYQAPTELEEAFDMMQELFEVSISIAGNIAEKVRQNALKFLPDDRKLLQEQYWQIRGLSEFIGRVLTRAYEPQEKFIKRDTKRKETTLEEYAELTQRTPETVDITGGGHKAKRNGKPISNRIQKRIVKQFEKRKK